MVTLGYVFWNDWVSALKESFTQIAPKQWRNENSQMVHYHDSCHDNSPVLHSRAVIGQSIFILDQHKFVYVIPVTNLR